MKFSYFHHGQLGLLLSVCVLVSSCNPEEYFPVEEIVEGADAYCAQAKDLHSCQQLADICQPAYEPLEIETAEPVFSVCVANPDLWSPNYGEPDAGDTTADTGTDPGTDPEVTDPVVTDPVGTAPTLQEAWEAKCEGLDPQYLWQMKQVKKKKGVIKSVKKVKVCHISGNSSSHTITIACPALKAHVNHDDYLGACQF